jgi:acetylornithine deacetylase/succinyl-diaminopimelate desuccinylase-like protein
MDPQAEATDVLSRLIRFDTVNPPGGERACQEWLKEHLEQAGPECGCTPAIPSGRTGPADRP